MQKNELIEYLTILEKIVKESPAKVLLEADRAVNTVRRQRSEEAPSSPSVSKLIKESLLNLSDKGENLSQNQFDFDSRIFQGGSQGGGNSLCNELKKSDCQQNEKCNWIKQYNGRQNKRNKYNKPLHKKTSYCRKSQPKDCTSRQSKLDCENDDNRCSWKDNSCTVKRKSNKLSKRASDLLDTIKRLKTIVSYCA